MRRQRQKLPCAALRGLGGGWRSCCLLGRRLRSGGCGWGPGRDGGGGGASAASGGAAGLPVRTRPPPPPHPLPAPSASHSCSELVGQGAYASVYSGVDSSCADVALKWEAPPCPWELYVGRALEARLPPHARPCALAPTSLLLGERASLLVAPLGAHGSLQQLLNARLAEAGQVGVVGGWVVGGVWWIARTRAGRLLGRQRPPPPPHTHTCLTRSPCPSWLPCTSPPPCAARWGRCTPRGCCTPTSSPTTCWSRWGGQLSSSRRRRMVRMSKGAASCWGPSRGWG